MTRLATGLEGTNGPQVKLDLKERVPPDFDANMFVSGANGRKLTNDLQQIVSSKTNCHSQPGHTRNTIIMTAKTGKVSTAYIVENEALKLGF